MTTVNAEKRKAFDKWRGKKPTSGYGYAIAEWDDETEELWQAWKAGSKHVLANPVKELGGTYLVVMYFRNDADRQEFVDVVMAEKPNLVARKL